jgi:hypothetical protein
MTNEQIINKYHLDKSHSAWDIVIDNWYSIEAFRLQTGKLPNEDGAPNDSKQVMMDFLDNQDLQFNLLRQREDFGSIYLSAKRCLYRYTMKNN